jgi:hypothetical protein
MVTTVFANLIDGLQFFSLFDQAFAQCLACYGPIIVEAAWHLFGFGH